MKILPFARLSLGTALFLLLHLASQPALAEDQEKNSLAFDRALKEQCSSDTLEWIPEQNRLLIHGKVNEKAALFKIDTGAMGSLLTLKSAKQFDVPIIDFKRTFSGAGGVGKVYGSPVNRLQLGTQVDLNRQRLAVIDLPVLQGIDGVVGRDTLATTIAIIDYRNHKLHIPSKDSPVDLTKLAAATTGMASTRLEKDGNYIFLTMQSGAESLRMLVDTGAQRTLLGLKAADRLKLALKENAERIVGAGDGAKTAKSARLDKLALGESTFLDLELIVAPLDYLATYSKKETDGVLGADCLAAAGAIISVADGIIVTPTGKLTIPAHASQTSDPNR